jgi:hypothetical protein
MPGRSKGGSKGGIHGHGHIGKCTVRSSCHTLRSVTWWEWLQVSPIGSGPACHGIGLELVTGAPQFLGHHPWLTCMGVGDWSKQHAHGL